MKWPKILLVSMVVVFGLFLVTADLLAQGPGQEPTPEQKAKMREAQEKLGQKKVDPGKVQQGKAFQQLQGVAGQGPGGKGDYRGGEVMDNSRPGRGQSPLDSVRQPVKPGKVPPVGPASPVDVKKSTAPAAAPQVGVGKSSSTATSPPVDPIKRAQDINRETYERSKKAG